jgi:hypothetical protein
MPIEKEYLGSFRQGTIVEYKETYTTTWVQLDGLRLIRCDDAAKETGQGAWMIEEPGRIHMWRGQWGYPRVEVPITELKPDLWIKDKCVRSREYEKDVS